MGCGTHGTLHCFYYTLGYKLRPGTANSNIEWKPRPSELSSFPSCGALGAYDEGNWAAAPGSFLEMQNLHSCNAPQVHEGKYGSLVLSTLRAAQCTAQFYSFHGLTNGLSYLLYMCDKSKGWVFFQKPLCHSLKDWFLTSQHILTTLDL